MGLTPLPPSRLFPAFWLMTNNNSNAMLIWAAIVIPAFGVLCIGLWSGKRQRFLRPFDAKVRYTGISFVYQFSASLRPGITPIIATSLIPRQVTARPG